MANVIIFSDSSKYSEKTMTVPIRMAGPFRIATELRQHGYSCQLVDFLFSFTQEEIYKVCSKLINLNTKVVAFSTTFWFVENNQQLMIHALNIINTIFKFVRDKYPNVKIVIGGTHTHKIKRLFKFDAEFIGYSDLLFLNYIKNDMQNSKNNDIPLVYRFDKHTETFNFSSSAIIYHKNDLINQNDTVSIEVSRGCIFKCKFCAFPLNGKKKIDYIKDSEILREELIRNYNDFQITNYIFSDDTFNDSTEKLKQLDAVISSLPFKIKFTAYMRIDLLYANPEQIHLLKNMGLIAANFGIESFNHASGKSIGKGMNPEIIKQFLFDLKTKHWGSDVNITIGMIVGLPYETLDNINETIKWINNRQFCVVDSITAKALSIINNPQRMWLSEFEANTEKYGYSFPTNNIDWVNSNFEIYSYQFAQQLEDKIHKECYNNHITGLNNNFVLLILNNLLRYADNVISFDDYCKTSNAEKAKWRQQNLRICIDRYVTDYKNKLFNLN